MHSNLRYIIREMGMHYIQPKPKREKSVITRRGVKRPDGSILWRDCLTGEITLEKSHNR